jgi:hypothetical protein
VLVRFEIGHRRVTAVTECARDLGAVTTLGCDDRGGPWGTAACAGRVARSRRRPRPLRNAAVGPSDAAASCRSSSPTRPGDSTMSTTVRRYLIRAVTPRLARRL